MRDRDDEGETASPDGNLATALHARDERARW
jgi:hypothetical protein